MIEKPRLIFVVSEDWYFLSHRLPVALAAKDHGFDVTVAARVDRGADAIRDHGFALEPLDMNRSGINPLSDGAVILRLAEIYRRVRPSVVHHVAMKPVLYGSFAAWRAQVPGVVNALMGLGFVYSSDSAKARALRPFVGAALKRALGAANSRVIVQNRDDYQMLLRERLAPAERIALIRGSGVDLDQYPATPLPAGRPRVVVPARLLRDKGILEFAAAAKKLRSDGVDAEFVLAGGPDPVNPTSLSDEDVRTLSADGSVTCLGWQTDMVSVFRSATLVCLPSYREGLPKALLEAAAAGRAIVATDVPGCREIVVPGVNGWLVPPRSVDGLAEGLRNALSDRARLEKFGAAGRALVEREHALPRIISETLGIYGALLEQSIQSRIATS